MITYDQALKEINELAPSLFVKIEKINLLQSVGRVLAEDIESEENIPYADNSAMDGFALNAEETFLASTANPISFDIRAIIAAGDNTDNQNTGKLNHSCVEIMTGALMPTGDYDSVAKVEDVKREGDIIIVRTPVPKGNNVRPKGTDFYRGLRVLSKNTIIKDQHIMALAALGISEVNVRKKIRVAMLSTGNEIVSFEQKVLKNSQVRNSSAPFLKVFLERNHCDVTLLGIQSDDPESFYQVMNGLLKSNYDLIITTGAVSMGKWDFITKTLPDLNMKTLFHKVAIRPGKPILLAHSTEHNTVLFGLPGNPISTAVGAQFFVLPLINKIMGYQTSEKWALLEADVPKPEGLECFFKAVMGLETDSKVTALNGQASYMIHSFVESNCWVQLPATGALIKAGSRVRVFDL